MFRTPRLPHSSPRAIAVSLIAALIASCGGPSTASSGQKPEFTIAIAYFAPDEGGERVRQGLFDSLKDAGIERGRNLAVKMADAQAEISNTTLVVQNFESQSGIDLIVTLTTPMLEAATNVVHKHPVVFTYVTDPIAGGAGTSRTDHLPNFTGIGSFPPIGDTIDVIQQIVPGVRSVGTLYNAGEANSTKVMSVARGAFAARGIKLVELTVASPGEVLQDAQALAARGVQALWISGDNTALQAFDAIAKVGADAKLPIILNDTEPVSRGAIASVGLGWYEAGHAAGKLAARVLRGESPKGIPIEEVAVKSVTLNQDVAKRLKITFPPDLLAQAVK